MKQNRKGIMSVCEYSIATLQNIKRGLMDRDNPGLENHWVIGGLLVVLTGQLLSISTEVINASLCSQEANAENDLLEIQRQFNEFIDSMHNPNSLPKNITPL